jgi:ribosomal protein S12 methylthiotransferase
VREERRARFMQVQAEISRARLQRKAGTVQRVLIDHLTPKGAMGRSTADAPEIDGLVHITTRRKLAVGSFIDVRIDRADEHDLFGVPA